MAFTLRITFSGLCLFVPEPDGSGPAGRMHVLMPGMFDDHCDGDRHVAAVAFDTGHLLQDGTPTGVTAIASLAGRQLTPVAGATASLALCGHIVDLGEMTQRSVDPDVLGADPQGKLSARVTLGAGQITAVAPGVCWEWHPDEVRPIAHRVRWEIPEVEGTHLALFSEPIGGGGEPKPLGDLYPIDGGVNLVVYHDIPQELPPDPVPAEAYPEPEQDFTPPHFAAYYALFGDDVTPVLPRYRGKEGCDAPANPCSLLSPGEGGLPYTCLIAGGGGGG